MRVVSSHKLFVLFVVQVTRSSRVKCLSREIIEKHYPVLTLDFHTNKKIVDDSIVDPSKRVRNQIAGFVTQLMKQLKSRGFIHGVDLAPYLDDAQVSLTETGPELG